jgi:hypothetical protein
VLVDVIRLRSLGQKLSAGQLRTALPVRGALGVNTRIDASSRKQERIVVACLTDPVKASLPLLPVLDYARLTRVRGKSFVLVGFEEVELHRRVAQTHVQAWWCRLVPIDGSAVEADEMDQLEELEPA